MTDSQIVFLSRLGSSVVLWSLALWTVFSGFEPGFFILIIGLGLVGLWEFFTILEKDHRPSFKITGMLCGALLSMGSFYYFRQSTPGGEGFAGRSYDFEVAALLTVILVVFGRQMFRQTRDSQPLETMAFTVFGLFYVPWLFSFVTKIVYLLPRDAEGHVTGHFYVLFLVVVTKFSDMGAYVTGSLIGKRLMAPHISPKKTWEGFIGALVFSALGGLGLWALMPGALGVLRAHDAVVLGLGLGFAAVLGDLGESVIKRSAHAKDSGRLLPGIGGALDLIDSILFTAPLMFFYLRFVIGLR